jgi:tripartite-type tricarboxylate transporter receptor subunit TctC
LIDFRKFNDPVKKITQLFLLTLTLLTVANFSGQQACAQGAFSGATMSSAVQNYPNRSIKILIPFTPGGTSDVIVRPLAEKMSEVLGQSVIVEYAPGAGGTLAATKVAAAAPDGYTLLLASTGALATGPNVTPVSYDPVTSFAPVGQVASSQYVIVVPLKSVIRDLTDLIERARATPKKLNYGSPGVGSLGHLAVELLLASTGIEMIHVPYRGQTPMDVDLYGGRLDIAVAGLGGTSPAIRDGRLRALALTGATHSAALPNVRTVAEFGVKDFDAAVFWGVVAPAGTDPLIIHKLSQAIRQVVQLKDVRDYWVSQGQDPVLDTPAQFAQLIKTESEKWKRVVQAAGIKE